MRIVVQFVKRVCRFLNAYKSVPWRIREIFPLITDPKLSQSYFPKEQRKSKLRIFLENLWWLLRYKEICECYYLYGFDRKRAEVRQSKYMPYSIFYKMQTRANSSAKFSPQKTDYRCVVIDKLFFGLYLSTLGFPTPKILAICDNAHITRIGARCVEPLESLLELPNFDGFCKDLLGTCGHGIFALSVRDRKLYVNDQDATIDELKKKIQGKAIIQERVHQHPRMAMLYPHSVNTIRIVTYLRDGEPVPWRNPFVRMGANGNRVDNWAVGGLLGLIDIDTGRLVGECFFKPGFGTKALRHPQTSTVFAEFEIPFFGEAVESVVTLHRFFYGIHTIGWDIAITTDGPIILEGNSLWSIEGHQLADYPLKDETIAMMAGL